MRKLALAALIGGSFLGAAIEAHAQYSPVITNRMWILPAGGSYDLPTTGNNVRGIGINPATGNAFYASTAGGSNHVTIISGLNGAIIGTLDGTGVTGGTVAMGGARASEDGAIYVCNVAAATSTLKVYRWESESSTNPPAIIFEEAGVATRFGDALDVRGAGTNTQIVIVGNGGARYRILQPAGPTEESLTNAPWLSTEFIIPGAGTYMGRGVAFEGTNNYIFGKTGGNASIYKLGFDLVNLTNWVAATIGVGDGSFVGLDYWKTNEVELISGVTYSTTTATNATTHRAKVFRVSGSNAVNVLDAPLPQPYFANGNGIGASGINNGYAVFCEPNNSVPAYQVQLSLTVPATITTQPSSETNVLSGGYYTLIAGGSGTTPLAFQWFKDGLPVAGATTESFTLTNVASDAAGFYALRVTNLYGTAYSTTAYVGVATSVQTSVATKLWTRINSQLFFLANDNAARGLAYNPVNGNVIVVSRTPTNGVHVLNGTTGAYLRSLDLTGVGGITGSIFDVNMVAVADDGAVFVCDLTTGGAGFAIYRWPDDSGTTPPTIAFQGDPLISRVGDTLSVAGTGMATTLFASARNGTQLAVFNTTDGFNWYPVTVDVTEAPAGWAGLGLFATATNKVWGKSSTFFLREVTFDLLAGTNTVTRTLNAGTDTLNPIAVDERNGLVMGVVTSQTPDNLAIWDWYGMSTTNHTPVLIDQEFFAADNPNINGTGQVALDLAGGRVFALNSNNGILAAKYAPPVRVSFAGGQLVLTWSGPAKLLRATDVAGPYTEVSGASSPYSTPLTGTAFYRLRN